MKNRTPKNGHKLFDNNPGTALPVDDGDEAGCATEQGLQSALRKTQQRYCTIALTLAAISGAVFILLGYPGLGKGLILGALFSVLNFLLMAVVLPMRLGRRRGKSLLISLSSIYLRYAILAVPLIWALKHDAIAISTAAGGLFMVQVAIVGDHLVGRYRKSLETG